MLIQKIRVDGYKNISNTTIDFEEIIALVGLNNYGKSNILEAIEFANKFIKVSPNVKSDMMRYTNCIPLNIQTENDNFQFEIEYTTEFEEKDICVNYEIEFEWPKDNSDGSKIVNETLKIKESAKGQKYNTYIIRKYKEATFKSSETGRCDKSIAIEDNNLVTNKLSNYDDLFYLDVIKELNQLKFQINTFLDASNAFEISPIMFKGESINELNKGTGNNIAEIIAELKTNDNDRYNILISSFLSLFPNIEDVESFSTRLNRGDKDKIPDDAPFTIKDIIYRLRVKEYTNNQYINFENLSNGTKRIFLLLTSAILADKDQIPLIAFEELEDCIHPKLFEQLLIILRKIINNCRIMITSHSPFLIQYLELDRIYIGVPTENGVAIFRKVKKSKQRTVYNNAKEQEISIGTYIFELLSNSCEDDSELCLFLECE